MATVQIRNLDDAAYEVLKKRAALSGRSLQEYLRLMLEALATSAERRDYFQNVRADLSWNDVDVSVADILAAIDEGRGNR